MPKVSIIVPVYKVEQYLARCIDSILAQTYKDWELLLIDDGSPDRSGFICDEYATKDPRIRVFHKENVSPDFTTVLFKVLHASFILEYLSFVSLGSLVEKLEIVLSLDLLTLLALLELFSLLDCLDVSLSVWFDIEVFSAT